MNPVPSQGDCNCPKMTPRLIREGVGTKPPCPVHDTPEVLAMLADVIVPRVEGPADGGGWYGEGTS